MMLKARVQQLLAIGALCACAVVPLTVHAQSPEEMPSGALGARQAGDPKMRARAHTELGAMYFQQGNSAVALDELTIALRADSNYYQAYSVRGLVYSFLKEYSKADEDFRSALRLAPQDPGVNNNYGWYLCETGREKEAMSYFMAAVRNPLYDTPARAFANAGACAMKMGDLANAESYLHRSLALSPEGAPATRILMARLMFKRNLLEEARRHLSEALRMMEPPSADALWLGLRLERKLGNSAAEGSYAAQLRSRYPASNEYQNFLNGKLDD